MTLDITSYLVSQTLIILFLIKCFSFCIHTNSVLNTDLKISYQFDNMKIWIWQMFFSFVYVYNIVLNMEVRWLSQFWLYYQFFCFEKYKYKLYKSTRLCYLNKLELNCADTLFSYSTVMDDGITVLSYVGISWCLCRMRTVGIYYYGA